MKPAVISPPPRKLPTAPPASSAATRAVMRGNRRVDTAPELQVRSALHAAGLRFRKDTRPVQRVRCRADVVFPRERVAVFIDGCYWHGCPEHGKVPRTNAVYWRAKLERNAERDAWATATLEDAGWLVLRFWEHEPTDGIVNAVRGAVLGRRASA